LALFEKELHYFVGAFKILRQEDNSRAINSSSFFVLD